MASVRKRLAADGSRCYDVVYRDLDRRQRWKTYRRKIDADAFANTVEADNKLHGWYIDPDAGKVTVKALRGNLADGADARPEHQEAVTGASAGRDEGLLPMGSVRTIGGCPASTSWPASTPPRPAGTDHVDLYQFYRWNYETPIEEIMRALHEVVQAGKGRHMVRPACMRGSSPRRGT